MKGSESQKWSVNFIDGYFEYILSLYKKEESSPKQSMTLAEVYQLSQRK